MRPVPAVIIGLFLLLAIALGANRYIHDSSQTMVKQLDTVEDAINSGKWEEANAKLSDMDETWQNTKNWWSILLHHQEMDNIDESLSRLKQYVEHKGLVLSVGELSTLKKFIDHISESQILTWQNIL